jgi:hypothetical protein
MPRSVKLAATIRRLSIPFGANATCAVTGSRLGQTHRYEAFDTQGPCAHNEQNTRYVVESGARQKVEDWDPEENGGYAVHGMPNPLPK